MSARTIRVMRCLLIFGAICGARQTAAPMPQQDGPRPIVLPGTPIPTGQAMDSLAEKLAAEIAARNMTGVAVVGFSGPDLRVTELGIRLRETLSVALAREAAGVKIPDADAIRNVLRTNRIAEDMVYSNALGGWIAKHMQMDGYVTARINLVAGYPVTMLAELFVCNAGVCEDSATFHAALDLTTEEIDDAGKDFVPTLKTPVVPEGVEGVSRPKCVTCPAPGVPQELRIENVQGNSHLLVTVLPDGAPDDLYVVRPMGHGLDSVAADAVLAWRFSPARDAKGIAVATQTAIDIPFKIEGVPVKKEKKK